MIGLSQKVGRPHGQVRPEQGLHGAAEWLARAQDATPDDGVAAFYDAKEKYWAASYPETTGYIIPTLYRYASESGYAEYQERANRMAAWESDIQLEGGGVRAGTMESQEAIPTIFNTGQVLFGWAAAWQETGNERFRQSLCRAADWLVVNQEGDGAWRRFGSPHTAHALNTYNTRVAFGLAHAGRLLGNSRYKRAAHANIEWTLTQALGNGWLQDNGLEDNVRPLSHTIAYALRGILEVGVLVGETHFMDFTERAASAVAGTQRKDGALPGRLDRDWRASARWSCLTGNIQMAVIWLRLSVLSGNRKWRNMAEKAITFVQSVQDRDHHNPGIRGGIGGSYPSRGGYMSGRYPNWAAKFFMDALMLRDAPEWVPDA